MKLQVARPGDIASRYAMEFTTQMQLGTELEKKCEWSCILWSKDHWMKEADKGQIMLQLAKDQLTSTPDKRVEEQNLDAHFRNTVSQVYSRLFNDGEKSCNIKRFAECPCMNQREHLLKQGAIAGIFVTILHRAVSYSMLDRHPLDSGLLPEEYEDVYGVDLTNYCDLEKSLIDGRFKELYDNVLRRAKQLSGLLGK
jgi:hypothetical protein